MSGTITMLRVTLNNINHDRPDDLQILLVSPTGKKFVLLADAGGTGTPAVGINLTFDDAAAALVPDSGPLATGSFKPTCVDAQNNIQTEFVAPAPAGPYDVPAPKASGTLALSFNGTAPNGTWSLYVVDDIPSTPGGAITGGWSLDISTGSTTQPSVTTVTSSLNPSFTGNAVTFTATVRQTNNAAITTGGVIFREGVTVLQGSNAVNAMGQVTFTTSALTEGVHIITAEYTGNASFFASSATITQRVDTATTISGNTFANRGVITVGDTANVYPSRIFVTNLSGTISKVTMNLSNVSHARPDDFEILLVAPNGTHFIVMTDAGGTLGMNNVTLNFDDAAAGLIPDASAPMTGNYRPTSYNSTPPAFPPPAPAGPYNHPAPAGGSTFANIFNGANPNGTWSLYVVDDVAGDIGTIAGGWSLTFTTSGDAPTMTTLASSLNPSLTGQSVTFTAAVKRVSNSAPVTNGTVTFREGATPLAANVALNTNGIATFTTALAEGNHIISADYNGVPGSFNVSSASITQRVDNATVVSSNRFSNPGIISIPGDGNPPVVYPSRILISGAGVVSNISITVSNISIDRPDDLELLLVSPTGTRMILLSDAGGTVTPASNVTLDFSDAGGSFVASNGPMVTGTFKPTSVNTTPPNFPPPAPPAPYNHPGPFGTATLGSVFGGTNPNGYWSLYVIDDVAGSGGTIGNGWSITLSTPPSITCPSNVVTTNALGQCQSAPVSFAATAGGFPAPTVRYQIAGTNVTSPLIFPVGVTTVTSMASNSFGTVNCTFTVTVNDVQRPTIQCSTNILISRDPGVSQGPVFFNVSASDNCSAPILVVTPASGANFGFGVTTVNAVATDAAGNSNTCSFTVTVNRNPVALPNSFVTPTNTLLNIPASILLTNDGDGDGDPISVSSVDTTSVNGGTIAFGGGVVTYRPPTNFFGPDYFQYTIADTRGGAASNLVIVSVTRADGLRLSLSRTNSTWWQRLIGAPGHTYLFQRADNVTGPWTNFAQAVAPTNTIILTNDPTSFPLPRRFYRAVELPPGGLSLWRGESNALDTFGRAHGTLLNGVGFAPGKLGRAFSFNGLDGLITNSGASIPIPWTASMWVNRQPSLDPAALLMGDDVSGLKLEQWPNSQLVGFTAFGIADYYFNYTAPVGTWVHLVFVGTPTGTRLYVNGVLTDINPATIPLGTRDMGRRPAQDRLNGLLDEVSIFNRALSPVEIKALYYSVP
jgi:subtilisin-like proprotein convertase family protein